MTGVPDDELLFDELVELDELVDDDPPRIGLSTIVDIPLGSMFVTGSLLQ